jgi:hypothetical protein
MLDVRLDPRVKTPAADLQSQFTLSKKLYDQAMAANQAFQSLQSVRDQLNKMAQGQNAPAVVKDTQQKVTALLGQAQGFGGGGGGRGAGARQDTVTAIRGGLMGLMSQVQEADAAPTASQAEAAAELQRQFDAMTPRLNEFKQSLPGINTQLKQAGLPELSLTPAEPAENPEQ